jgi:hypothetical protein
VPATLTNHWLDVTSQIIKRYSPIEHKMGKNYSELHLRVETRKEAMRIKDELWKLGYVTAHRLVQKRKSGTEFWVDVAKPSTLEIAPQREIPARPESVGDTLIQSLKKSTPDIKFPAVGFYRIERNPITCKCQVWYNAGGMDCGVIKCSEDELGVVLEDLYEDGLKNEFQIPRRKKSTKLAEKEIKRVEVDLVNYRVLVATYEPGKPRNAVMPEIASPKPKPEQSKSNPKPRFVVEVWDGTKEVY